MIGFELEWREVACTCAPCVGCGEIIYGKQYQLFTVINEKASPNDAIVCGSCYEEIQKGD